MREDLFRSELSSVNHKGLKAFTGERRLCQGGEKLNVKENQQMI